MPGSGDADQDTALTSLAWNEILAETKLWREFTSTL